MTTNATDELTSFHDYLTRRLQAGEPLTPEVALARWREQEATIAAVEEGLQAVDEGRTKSLGQFVNDFRERHDIAEDA